MQLSGIDGKVAVVTGARQNAQYRTADRGGVGPAGPAMSC